MLNHRGDDIGSYRIQFTGDEGIESLNYWLGTECYDNDIMVLLTYSHLMEFLTKLEEDVDFAWENYNKERQKGGLECYPPSEIYHVKTTLKK